MAPAPAKRTISLNASSFFKPPLMNPTETLCFSYNKNYRHSITALLEIKTHQLARKKSGGLYKFGRNLLKHVKTRGNKK